MSGPIICRVCEEDDDIIECVNHADTDQSLRRRRAGAQLLSGTSALSAPEIVSRLLAVQAQDLRGARLALRARGGSLTAAEVNRALTTERSLLVAWLGRGTLHLVHRDDYPWLLGLTAATRLTANRRRLEQEGVSPDEAERAVSLMETALSHEGPLTRDELAQRMVGQGIRTEGQATPHLLMFAALRGVALMGPLKNGKQAFALTEDWLGARPHTSLEHADRVGVLAELARRYLTSHGPATPADLAAWAGLPLRDVRAGFGSISDELVQGDGDLVGLGARGELPPFPPPNLLPAFDPYLLGWKDRDFIVSGSHRRLVHPGGGVLRAVVLVDGAAVGTWSARRRGGALTISVDSFSSLSDEVTHGLREQAADVARFEGLTLNQ